MGCRSKTFNPGTFVLFFLHKTTRAPLTFCFWSLISNVLTSVLVLQVELTDVSELFSTFMGENLTNYS